MKKISLCLLFLSIAVLSYSQDILTGVKANAVVPGTELVRLSHYSGIPDYIRFNSGKEIMPEQIIPYLQQHFQMNASMSFTLLNVMPDRLGFTHYRYQQTFNGIPIQGTMYIVHVKDGKVVSMNGMIFPTITAATAPGISESDALQHALQYVNASLYRWQVPEDEALLKMMQKNPAATWYPKGVLTYAPDNGNYLSENYKLTFCFDVFAKEPYSRQYIYVDAQLGTVIFTLNRIEDNNPKYATAATAYSGNKTIVTDSEGVNRFYLRDTLRGGGVVTLNMNHSTSNYNGATNFEDDDNFWNNVNAQRDQYATDAHLGLEKTYDFYDSTYNRNSVDNNGIELFGFVHYSSNWVNASWDGTEMNFGDGDSSQGISPLTTLDITGHEMTHGVTQYTCNLNYAGESGGLNESFSDCAGEMVEKLGKGVNDWLVGAEIGSPFRFFSNPALDGASASSYQDANWFKYGDVHFWSGVQNHWFYILANGDTATNDLGDAYSVKGIGIDEAHAIAYRNQSVYLVPSSNYADARFYAIMSAEDLFGECSQQHISCANAWYAVGVGSPFIPGVNADFTAAVTSLCSLSNGVYFTNLSNNGRSFLWNFGDGTTSTDVNPTHQYSSEGTYTITLNTDGGTCGSDSVQKENYVTITLPDLPFVSDTTACANGPAVLTGSADGTMAWYDAPSGGNLLGLGSPFFTSPVTTNTTFYGEDDLIAPIQSAGEPTNTFGTGGYFTQTNPHYLFFDAYQNFTLQSVTVYANISGVRIIELLDNAGNVIQSLVITISTGMQTVALNFHISAGTGYQLGLKDGTMSQLYRNQSGAKYPYTIPELLSITGNDAGSGYYYYFYNWQVQKDLCASGRLPLTVTVLPSATALFTYTLNGSNPSVTFINNSINATSYEWIFGDGTTSTEVNPIHDYVSLGNYTVQLIAYYGSCSDTLTQAISMLTGIGSINNLNGVSISPNPFENYLQVNYSGSHSAKMKVQFTDVLGHVLLSQAKNLSPGNHLIELNTDRIPSGIYFVHVEMNDQSQTYRVVKQE